MAKDRPPARRHLSVEHPDTKLAGNSAVSRGDLTSRKLRVCAHVRECYTHTHGIMAEVVRGEREREMEKSCPRTYLLIRHRRSTRSTNV
jgi:hypothetical protein